MSSRPRAFRLDPKPEVPPHETATRPAETRIELPSGVVIVEEPDEAVAAADGVPVLDQRPRGFPFAGLLMGALGALVSLAIGLGIERLVADLFAAAPALGWVALALVALALLALLGIVVRELRGILRERRIEALRGRATEILAARDGEGAKALARDLAAFYADRTTRGPGPGIDEVADAIMDAADRLALVERTLLRPLDAEAKRAVAEAAKQVSVVTALSPRAIVDVAFVVYAAVRLLRRIAAIYGGRPGLLGFLRLLRAAVNHLVVTGGVAVGDSLLQQVLGLGLAARISAKLGEGALNGLMTARFGLAALEVCRPLPFVADEPPRLGDVAGEILPGGRAD